MSFYQKGLSASTITLGSWADPHLARVSAGRQGASLVNKASKHFYKRGITGQSETAFQKRSLVVGGAMDSATGFLMDVVHLLLLLGGAYILVNAIFA